jgi:non-canonical purine NTP pyrophosphatase (RdgB/HAM1 family)
MNELIFATTNSGKAATLQEWLDRYAIDIRVTQRPLDLVEQQADDALEVAQAKAVLAYEQLRAPLVVDDSAFHIPALGGFPGVYQKYIIETIGAAGIIKLMEEVEDRSVYFISNLVYCDAKGVQHCFSDSHYDGTVAMAYDPQGAYSWAELGKIFIPAGADRVATELSPDERVALQRADGFVDAYEEFVKWYGESHV